MQNKRNNLIYIFQVYTRNDSWRREWMKHEEISSPFSAPGALCSWTGNGNKWWVLRGLSCSLTRLSLSWVGTRLLIQFSSTKPCWLLWGVSPPPLQFPLLSPSSIPSTLAFPCSCIGDFCNTVPALSAEGYREKIPRRWAKGTWPHSSAPGIR